MHHTVLALGLFAVFAVAQNDDAFSYLPIHFVFHGAAASYPLDIYADGNSYNTNNDIPINIIDAGTFPAWTYCNFATPDKPAFADLGNETMLGVGPPTTINSVACRPTPNPPDTCLPVYASCEWCGGGAGGCYTLDCCSGYCAATKCRPTS